MSVSLLRLAPTLLLAAATTTVALGQSTGSPSEEASLAWARQLEQSIALGERGVLLTTFDAPTFAHRMVGSSASMAKVRPALEKNMAGQGGALADIVLKALQGNGTYTFLGLRDHDGKRVALFRLEAQSGINYHEWLLTSRPGKGVGVGDVFIALTGDWYSQTLYRVVHSLMPVSGSPQDREAQAKIRNLMMELNKRSQAGDRIGVRETLDAMPAHLRREEWWFLAKARTFDLERDKEAYIATMNAFGKAHPAGKGFRMLSLDYHFVLKDWNACLADLETLKQAVGGDPHLDFVAANILRLRGAPALALERTAKVLEGDPRHRRAHDLRLQLALDLEQFGMVADELTAQERDINLKIPDLSQIPRFKAFLASPEYREWQRQREAAASAP